MPDGTRPAEYLQTWNIKLAFVIIFEVCVLGTVMSLHYVLYIFVYKISVTLFLPLQHLLFILAALFNLLVPDLPKSVQEEIRREKLLAARITRITRITSQDKLERRARSKSDSDLLAFARYGSPSLC